MKTERLTKELIPEVTNGGNDALVRELEHALEQAEVQGQAIYVHYEKGWLQRVPVDLALVDDPSIQARLHDDNWWAPRCGRVLRHD